VQDSQENPKSLEDLKLESENLHIHTEIGGIVHKSILEAEKSIKIVSPFLGKTEVDLLRDKKLGGLDGIALVTRIAEDTLHSDEQIEALKKIIIQKKQKNVDGYSYAPVFQSVFFDGYSLHEKIYLIDDDVAYLGSFNFTRSGMHTNHETCLIIKDADIIQKLNVYFSGLLVATAVKWDIAELGKRLYEKKNESENNIGYCIKCKSPIAYDKRKPLCRPCYDAEQQQLKNSGTV
jgi:phosphatidylserine/phosphatidylglycerophosphate/cardiolipin synthase-like enzyme